MMNKAYLARLAGARPEILEKAPGEQPKFTTLGAVLVATSIMAAVSAVFALTTTVGLHWSAAVAVGLVWGLIILNLDRLLIVTMTREDGAWRNILVALPRLLLAVILGAIISMPLVLRIFQPEINAELVQLRAENIKANQEKINSDENFKRIPGLEAEVARLDGIASGRTSQSPSTDPLVMELTTKVQAKQSEYDTAEQAVICEVEGDRDCGSGRVGRGPAAAEKVIIRDRALRELNELKTQLADATRLAQERIDADSANVRGNAERELALKRAELDLIRTAKADLEQQSVDTQGKPPGMIEQLRALERLSDTGTLTAARWALFALFAAIEILPVFAKLLSLLGKESVYDRLLRNRDEDALATESAESTWKRDRAMAEMEAQRVSADAEAAIHKGTTEAFRDMTLQIERDRAAMNADAGRRQTANLVKEQEKIANRHIELWAQAYAQASDKDLDNWYQQQSGQAQPIAPTGPAPVTAGPPPAAGPPTKADADQPRSRRQPADPLRNYARDDEEEVIDISTFHQLPTIESDNGRRPVD